MGQKRQKRVAEKLQRFLICCIISLSTNGKAIQKCIKSLLEEKRGFQKVSVRYQVP